MWNHSQFEYDNCNFARGPPSELSLSLAPTKLSSSPNHSIKKNMSKDWHCMKGGWLVLLLIYLLWFSKKIECSRQNQSELSELWNIPWFQCWTICKTNYNMWYSLNIDWIIIWMMWIKWKINTLNASWIKKKLSKIQSKMVSRIKSETASQIRLETVSSAKLTMLTTALILDNLCGKCAGYRRVGFLIAIVMLQRGQWHRLRLICRR